MQNLERPGVSVRGEGLIGHKTEACIAAYSTADELRMREKAGELKAWAIGQQKPTTAGRARAAVQEVDW